MDELASERRAASELTVVFRASHLATGSAAVRADHHRGRIARRVLRSAVHASGERAGGQPPVRDTINASAQFTGWLPPTVATASGTEIPESVQQTFASFVLHARHTSLFNTDFDFQVSEITSILHATAALVGTFSVWQPSVGFGPASGVGSSQFYLGSPITGVHTCWGSSTRTERSGVPTLRREACRSSSGS